jgi:hypothetical protein
LFSRWCLEFSFISTISNAVRVIAPNAVAALILIAVSGPMISQSTADAATSTGNGLFIATGVTIGLCINYTLRVVN